ncbi:MAG: lipoprotein-releasing ABC transporter permease subunit [Gammaproteobacteria bacterium]|jgi:lipoprotein-releasing system permease protein|nr:lipoprotein-releasing ABC transporter permease subunit [Gammaproteobacteria bacterium]MDX2462170.1 lipoprotein-releasing ABC transporter permease subunit [Gammaproteobacteria bacterium]
MFKPLEIYVGLRYTRAKRRNHFISFISLSSMLGIALGVTALIAVLSVMNGFEKELRERILGMASHATVSRFRGPLKDWQGVAERARQHPHVVGVAPYVQGEAMLTRGRYVRGALVQGVLPDIEPEVSEIDKYMTAGSLDSLRPGEFNVILGNGLAGALGARVGDKVTVVAPKATPTPAGILPRLRRFTVTGIFEVKHGQYDNQLAVVNVEDAARLFQLDGGITGLRLKLDDMFLAPAVGRELAADLPGTYWVRDWTHYHANFFRALKTEKTVMFVILTLIVAVAAFNIVSALTMVVTDKESDIAILRTLGVTPASVMLIFIVQGTLIGLIGTLLGMVGGIALANNVETLVPAIEQLFDTKFLSPDIYYISDVPSDMRWPDVALISAVAFVMSIVATIYPAWRASRTQPAEALRYE